MTAVCRKPDPNTEVKPIKERKCVMSNGFDKKQDAPNEKATVNRTVYAADPNCQAYDYGDKACAYRSGGGGG